MIKRGGRGGKGRGYDKQEGETRLSPKLLFNDAISHSRL